MLLKLADAAEACGRSPYTLRRLAYEGRLNVVKQAGGFRQWLVDVDDLAALLTEIEKNYRTRRFVPGPGRGHKKRKTR